MTTRCTALGGLGEFGANSMVVTAEDGRSLVVDAGIGFVPLEAFGVAYEVPDFAALLAEPPAAAVITHAHDDHMKGLPHLVAAYPGLPVAAGGMTRQWAGSVDEDRRVAVGLLVSGELVGGFQVDSLPVSHSIPGTLALRLHTPQGPLVHASDLRLAPSALGESTDRETLAKWGDDGVNVAFLDATNALEEADPPEESQVADALVRQVQGVPGLVVAVTFASHLGRLHQLALAASAAGRVVVPLGQGLQRALAVGRTSGTLVLPAGLVRHARELGRLPRDRVLVVATGTQGESGSAFPRIVHGEVAAARLGPGDRVLHAARVIPGHERRLNELLDACVGAGADVVTAADAPIHATGHPPRRELEELLSLLRPTWVVPVHGRRRNLEELAVLARRMGCRTVVVESGEELALGDRELTVSGSHPGRARILVGQDGMPLSGSELRQRRRMGREGVMMAVLEAPGDGGRIGDPVLHAEGVNWNGTLLPVLSRELGDEMRRLGPVMAGDPDALAAAMGSWLRRELLRRGGRRPLVVPLVRKG